MPASVKQLRDNQNNFIYPKIAKEGLVEPIYGSDVTISTIDGLNSSDVQGALNELVTNLGNIDSVLDNVEIVKTASESVISVSDSAAYKLQGLKLYGKSVQDGTPTPEAPVEIESAGDGGDVTVTICGKQLLNFNFGKYYTDTDGTIVSGNSYKSFLLLLRENESIYISGNFTLLNSGTIRVGTFDEIPELGKVGTRSNIVSSKSITTDKDIYIVLSFIPVDSTPNTLDQYFAQILKSFMVNYGDSALPWEPYTGKTLTYPTPNGLPGIPVESGGNYTDAEGQQWICDEVDFGAGKKTQLVGVIDSYNSESVGDVYMSSTGQLTTGAKVLYPLSEPTETDLTPEQLTAYVALTTYKPNTTITTDSDPAAGMEVRYLTNNGLAEVLEKYATQAWVEGKGYLTAVPDGYVTSADVAATYAKKALKFTATFTSSDWTSATGGFSQAVNVAGLTADDEPIIDLNSTATDADTFNGQLEAFGLVSNFTTGDGTLTAVVLGDSAPTVDIPIHGVVVY